MKLPIFDLVTNYWLPEACGVEYRGSLLTHLFPEVEFAIGDCSSMLGEKKPDYAAIAKLLDTGFDDYQIVGASGARKHGRVLFAKGGGDYFSKFFGSNANAINYGSNLTTECSKILDMTVDLLVVKDGEWDTGDCHGKMNCILANALPGTLTNPFQFRAASLNPAWIAKGTIAYSDDVDASEYDLVLPVSCFKGNKVEPGAYRLPLTLGLVFASPEKWRRANLSYSVLQFIPWGAVETDILPKTLEVAQQLNEIANDQLKLAQMLGVNDGSADDNEDEEKEDYSDFEKILKADVHGQLTSHPWFVNSVSKLFCKRWVRLATAGAVKFNSSMVMPDETIPNDCICIPTLPDGAEVIVFPYPCRWKYDIKVWRNVYIKNWEDSKGIIIGNQKTLLKLGRDTDGDFMYWLPATKLPNVAIAIKAFGEPSIDQGAIKPKKQPVTGTLGEIAVKSMSNETGLITWLIAKAWAVGREDWVLQLVPQLQAAVDSLKGAAPPDKKLLNSIAWKMNGQQIAWLKDKEHSDTYIHQIITDDGRADTISNLVREVNKLWVAPTLRKSKLSVFAPLFAGVKIGWLERAYLRISEFSHAMGVASSEERKYDKEKAPQSVIKACQQKRNAVTEHYKSLLDGCTSEQRMDAVGAFWNVKHQANSTDKTNTYLCFLVGVDQICEQLKELRITKLHFYPKFADEETVWTGETVGIKLVRRGNYLHAVNFENQSVGSLAINDSPLLFPGIWFEASLQTRFNKKNQPSFVEVTVLDNF